jgi:hypothetical protein
VAVADMAAAVEVEEKVVEGVSNKHESKIPCRSNKNSIANGNQVITRERGNMAKRNRQTIKKHEKEYNRKEKAKEKLARRQAKKDQVIIDVDQQNDSD